MDDGNAFQARAAVILRRLEQLPQARQDHQESYSALAAMQVTEWQQHTGDDDAISSKL